MSSGDTPKPRNRLRWLALSVLILLSVGLQVHRVLIEANFSPEAAFEYGMIAQNLAEGDGYSLKLGWGGMEMPTVHMPPGITFILAGLYWLDDVDSAHFFFQMLQVAASAVTLVCVWQLTRKAFSERAAWVAAVLYVIDLNLMFTTVWVNETVLNMFFVYLGLWAVVRLDENPRYLTAAAVGLCFSLGALIRPVVLLILTLSLLWFLYRHRRQLWVPVRHCALTSVVVFSVLAPWTVRNYQVTQKFVPICSNWAINFWLSYNPAAAGSQFDAHGKPLRPTGALKEQLRDATSELEMDELLSAAGWKYVHEHPLEALQLRPYCFLYFWLDHNYWLDPMPFPTSWRIRRANFLLVGLTALGILANWRVAGVSRLLLMIMMTSALFYTVFHADIGNRFRMQMEPIMLIFIGQLLVQSADWLRRRTGSHRSV
jgi:hypothetical protein